MLPPDFQVADAGAFASVRLRLEQDDGAGGVCHGTEVTRSNLPVGLITYATRESSTIAGSAEDASTAFALPTTVLR